MNDTVRVLVTPRDDNPYYDLLYSELAGADVDVTFTDGPTGSQTINLFMFPMMMVAFRARGYRVLHIHWLFKFALPWVRGASLARRLVQLWLRLYLWTAHALGFRIVWTAHDLVPHEQIFFDDQQAHQALIRRCDLVVALSADSASQLLSLGARDVRVIPLGPYARRHATTLGRADARAAFAFDEGTFVVTWIGKVGRYKGVDSLLEAISMLPDGSSVRALIAGPCSDPGYLGYLESLSSRAGKRAVVRFERLDDDEIGACLTAADLAVFPFREVTNSSSVLTALSFGVPVVVPDLGALRDLPAACVVRYDPEQEDLSQVLERAASLTWDQRYAMSRAALAYTSALDWPNAARDLLSAYRGLVA